MKNKYLIHIISVSIGTFTVYLLMQLEGWINRSKMSEEEIMYLEHFMITDLFLIMMFFGFVLSVQFILVQPTLDLWIEKSGIKSNQFFAIGTGFTVINGIVIGLWFGDSQLGYIDVLQSIGIWTLVFGVFYLANLVTVNKLYQKITSGNTV